MNRCERPGPWQPLSSGHRHGPFLTRFAGIRRATSSFRLRQRIIILARSGRIHGPITPGIIRLEPIMSSGALLKARVLPGANLSLLTSGVSTNLLGTFNVAKSGMGNLAMGSKLVDGSGKSGQGDAGWKRPNTAHGAERAEMKSMSTF